MKRALWKLPFIHSVFFKKSFLKGTIKNLILRNSFIPAIFLDKHIKLYNGIWFLSQTITKDMLGLKFGQFAFTKRSDKQLQRRRKTKKKNKK